MPLDLQTMTRVAEYVRIKRSAKLGARGSLAFGLLAMISGLVGLGSSVLAIPLLALGVFLVGTGIWVQKKTSAAALRWDAIAVWAVASWNIVMGLLSVIFSDGGGALWIVIGAWQVYWGVQARRRALIFGSFLANPGSDASLAELERLVAEIQASSLAQSADLIEFDSASLTTRQHWKARLGKDWAVFVDAAGADVVVTAPQDVTVAKQGETAIRHRIKAQLMLAKRSLKGTIPKESLDRITSWKAAQAH
jgi:hypothetical protein